MARVTFYPTGTHERHAMRIQPLEVELMEAGLSRRGYVLACKCGRMEPSWQATKSAAREAYREHTREES